MPHFDGELAVDVWPAVSPITGNTDNGGCAYDGAGKGLYATYSSGFKCYRTIGAASTLIYDDDSVEYLSTIVTDTFAGTARCVALTVVDGTLYATISGHNTTAGRAGSWLYRDTSGQTGAGPWVKHGTFEEIAPSGLSSDQPIFGHHYGSEIFVMPNGRWIASWARTTQVNLGGTQRIKFDMAVGYSDDNGANWTLKLVVRQQGVGGLSYDGVVGGADTWHSVSIESGPRSFGLIGGKAYLAIANNSGGQAHFHSADGISWTQYSLSSPYYTGGGNSVRFHPMSDGSRIFRTQDGDSFYSAEAAPESQPVYTTLTTLDLGSTAFSQIAFCDIDVGGYNRVAATRYGKVQGIGFVSSRGWVVGSASSG